MTTPRGYTLDKYSVMYVPVRAFSKYSTSTQTHSAYHVPYTFAYIDTCTCTLYIIHTHVHLQCMFAPFSMRHYNYIKWAKLHIR